MKGLVLILLLSLLPTFIIFGMILYSDRKSKEPVSLLTICLFSGFLTIAFSVFLQGKVVYLLDNLNTINNTIYQLTEISVLAAIEELSKLIVLYVFISHRKSYDDIYDGFVYSSIIALSFACIETIFYVFKQTTISDMTSLALIRTFTSLPLHLVCGIIMGYYVSLEKFSKVKKYKVYNLFKAFFIPVFIHSFYNIFINYLSPIINNRTMIILFLTLIVIFIYIVGILYIGRNKSLNEKFIKNKKYPKKYSYLIHRREFKRNNQN